MNALSLPGQGVFYPSQNNASPSSTRAKHCSDSAVPLLPPGTPPRMRPSAAQPHRQLDVMPEEAAEQRTSDVISLRFSRAAWQIQPRQPFENDKTDRFEATRPPCSLNKEQIKTTILIGSPLYFRTLDRHLVPAFPESSATIAVPPSWADPCAQKKNARTPCLSGIQTLIRQFF